MNASAEAACTNSSGIRRLPKARLLRPALRCKQTLKTARRINGDPLHLDPAHHVLDVGPVSALEVRRIEHDGSGGPEQTPGAQLHFCEDAVAVPWISPIGIEVPAHVVRAHDDGLQTPAFSCAHVLFPSPGRPHRT